MFLLDTVTISELERLNVNAGVAAWVSSVEWEDLFLSAVTVAELWQGIVRLPNGKKRRELEANFDLLADRFQGRILPIDVAVACRYAELQGRNPLPVLDTFIGATALVHRLTVVTRNTADIGRTGALILDPWT